jgi:hypothetical protein
MLSHSHGIPNKIDSQDPTLKKNWKDREKVSIDLESLNSLQSGNDRTSPTRSSERLNRISYNSKWTKFIHDSSYEFEKSDAFTLFNVWDELFMLNEMSVNQKGLS